MNKLSRYPKNVAASVDRRLRRLTGRPLRAREDGGQSLVEFVLVLPVLLVLVFGIIEFANAWRTSQIVTNGAREGARMAVLPKTSGVAGIEARVKSYLANSGLDETDAVVSVDCDLDGDGDFGDGQDQECPQSGQAQRINVQFDFTFSFLGPMINFMQGSGGDQFGTITLDATTIMRTE